MNWKGVVSCGGSESLILIALCLEDKSAYDSGPLSVLAEIRCLTSSYVVGHAGVELRPHGSGASVAYCAPSGMPVQWQL